MYSFPPSQDSRLKHTKTITATTCLPSTLPLYILYPHTNVHIDSPLKVGVNPHVQILSRLFFFRISRGGTNGHLHNHFTLLLFKGGLNSPPTSGSSLSTKRQYSGDQKLYSIQLCISSTDHNAFINNTLCLINT